jgi:hypothetical protein
MLLQDAVAVVCWSGICGLGSIEIGSLGPINMLPFDPKFGFPESRLGLLPDINKPPVEPVMNFGQALLAPVAEGR